MSVDNGGSQYQQDLEHALTKAEEIADMWMELAHHFADELVDRWNETGEVYTGPASLSAFMGLSDAQYAAWVEGRWKVVLS